MYRWQESLLPQPGCYQADFQPVAARRHQTSAMLAMGSKSIQTTQNAVPSMQRIKLQALVNDVMLVATTFVYICIVDILSAICRIATPLALPGICQALATTEHAAGATTSSIHYPCMQPDQSLEHNCKLLVARS